MSEENTCNFIEAWRARCGKENCTEHAGLKCSSCGQPATRSCDATSGFVCGSPLCDDCVHELDPDGTNGRTGKHCKEADQKHKPWYAQDEAEQKRGAELQAELDAARHAEIDRLIAIARAEAR